MPKSKKNVLFQKLNNLHWYDENIELIKQYITTKQFPPTFSEFKRRKWAENYKNFSVVDDYLQYDDAENDLSLTVIPNSEVESTLHDMYTNPDEGYGLGIQSFYEKIRFKYLNISRQQAIDFLKKQTAYQLTKKERPIVNKPIVGNYPNERWAIDLVDIKAYESHNKGNKWILTGIDYFSKKVFGCALFDKSDRSVVEGLQYCVDTQMEGTYPHLLQSDNGSEFKNYRMKEWAERHGVTQIFTDTHTPTGNALIENANNFIRRMIREGFVRHSHDPNPMDWVNHLQHYLNSRNDSKHSVTKKKPDEIWVEGRDFNKKHPAIVEIKEKLIAKAKKRLTEAKHTELKVGDFVRISNAKLYSEVRKVIKEGGQKHVPIKFSPQIYMVATVIRPKKASGYSNNQYEVKTLNGHIVRTETRINQMGGQDRVREAIRFFASELQKVDKDSEVLLTNAEGQKLNNIGINDFNAEEIDEMEQERERKRARAKELAQARKENKKKEEPVPERRSTRTRVPNRQFNDYVTDGKIEVNFNDPDNNV
jgi:hypothetical protein